LTLVEPSPRLDAVASAGLGISRSKLVKLVDAGEVLVDWRAARAAAAALKGGEVVSVRGVGRLVVEAVEATAKGRVRVRCVRVT
jgi:RNA-binding protein YlmH